MELIQLEDLRRFYNSGATRSYQFRKEQLKKLRQSILNHEKELHQALYADLGKSPEESWVTETGIVLSEIKAALKDLRSWMAPEYLPTNFLNLPSSSKVLREPLGVVLVIGPWNYPFQLLINPVVGAIAAGNCVVLKPSEFAGATASTAKKIIEAVFPKDYILYVEGEGAEVIPAMMNQFSFDHVFYTGSTQTGRQIYKMAAERLVPVTLELGGKSPCVVEDDANINVAARRIAVTKFSNAGQMCVAPDFILVSNKIKDKLVEKIRKAVKTFFGENPVVDYSYGKIINQKQFDRLTSYLEQGKILFGGRKDKDKLFIEPTIVEENNLDSSLMTEEIFGPVLPVIGFDNKEEALSIINQQPHPLAFYIYTSDKNKEDEWLRDVHSGGASVNNSSWHFTNYNLPFGGRGLSGTGSYHGRYSFETFSHRKAVMKTPTWFDPDIKYPPFKGKLNLYKKFIG